MAQTLVSSHEKLFQRLSKENFEFKKLSKEHEMLEDRLKTLTNKKFLSTAEELEKRELQKKKLSGKDRMEQILKANSQRNMYA